MSKIEITMLITLTIQRGQCDKNEVYDSGNPGFRGQNKGDGQIIH